MDMNREGIRNQFLQDNMKINQGHVSHVKECNVNVE